MQYDKSYANKISQSIQVNVAEEEYSLFRYSLESFVDNILEIYAKAGNSITSENIIGEIKKNIASENYISVDFSEAEKSFKDRIEKGEYEAKIIEQNNAKTFFLEIKDFSFEYIPEKNSKIESVTLAKDLKFEIKI
jgi:hypothetical protein